MVIIPKEEEKTWKCILDSTYKSPLVNETTIKRLAAKTTLVTYNYISVGKRVSFVRVTFLSSLLEDKTNMMIDRLYTAYRLSIPYRPRSAHPRLDRNRRTGPSCRHPPCPKDTGCIWIH